MSKWIAFTGSLLLAAVTVFGIVHFNQRENENRQVAVQLAGIEAKARHMSALEWEAIAEAEATSEAVQELAEVRYQLLAAARRLRAQYPDRRALGQFERCYKQYASAVDDELRLLQAGDFARAKRLDDEKVDPSFDELIGAVHLAQSSYEGLAHQALRRTQTGLLVLVFGSTAAFLGLFWQYESARQRTRVAIAEQHALRSSEERFRALTENSSDLIAILGVDHEFKYVSPSAARTLGFDDTALVGTKLVEFVHPEDAAAVTSWLDSSAVAGKREVMEFRLRSQVGAFTPMAGELRNLVADPKIGGLLLNARDVSERKETERQLIHQALHDSLTKLPNRGLFMDRIEAAVSRVRRHHGSLAAVLFIDLDDFKVVNDSLGHDAGDELIREAGRRVQHSLRGSDTVGRPVGDERPDDTVARLGGDEFTVLLEDITDPTGALRVAERIQSSFTKPFLLAGQEVFKSASIGIAVTAGENNPEELLRNADLAMYRAKTLGRARCEMFDAAMHSQVMHRLKMESELRRAIEREEFRLHYQPIVSLETWRVTGLEALLRWERPGAGLVYPADFLPLAEETGLIRPIGTWVLRHACGQMAKWHAEHPNAPPISIAVHVSGKQFNAPGFTEIVADTLRQTGLSAATLHLEITESVAMEDAERTRRLVADLKAMGVQLMLDDFGTGYSSMSYLRRFAVNTIKIDRSFVSQLHVDVENRAIVKTIIALATALQIDVVAEGLEEIEELHELRRAGCKLAQGYFFSKPVDGDAILHLLANPTFPSVGQQYQANPSCV